MTPATRSPLAITTFTRPTSVLPFAATTAAQWELDIHPRHAKRPLPAPIPGYQGEEALDLALEWATWHGLLEG